MHPEPEVLAWAVAWVVSGIFGKPKMRAKNAALFVVEICTVIAQGFPAKTPLAGGLTGWTLLVAMPFLPASTLASAFAPVASLQLVRASS